MKSLMELVNVCEKVNGGTYEKGDVLLEKAGELEQLGFKGIAKDLFDKVEIKIRLSEISKFGYIRIEESAIKVYLKSKVDSYNKHHPKTEGGVSVPVSFFGFGGSWFLTGEATDEEKQQYPKHPIQTIEERTNDYTSGKEGTIGRFIWTETPLEQRKSIPPVNVLETLKQHQKRNLFDYYTIAEVNSVVDPLLLGRIEGVSDRFFICQWGNDIQLDDLI